MNEDQTENTHLWDTKQNIEDGVEDLFREMCILRLKKEVVEHSEFQATVWELAMKWGLGDISSSTASKP